MVSGALIGAVVGLLVVLVFMAIAKTKTGSLDMPVQRSGTVAASVPPEEVLRRLEAAAPRNGLKVEQVDAAGGRILLSDGTSFTSFGNFYPIAVAPAASGAEITVGLKTKAPQYGPVVGRNHNRIMDKVRTMVAGG
ncbi:MAG: hypothetical protein H6842_04710 [Rhodospirillaceae bacterium]|nr:hypothetical protein [Rhodospirillaceae bacterium]